MRIVTCLAIVGVGLLATACDSTRFTDQPDASAAALPQGIGFRPHQKPFGVSMAGWEERWWQWELSVPAAVNPSLDQTGANCAQGQNDPNVWYLASTFGSGTTNRSCTVPRGRAILVNLSSALNDYPCPDPNFHPGPGQSLFDFLLPGAQQVEDGIVTLSLSVDGKSMAEPFKARVHTPLFNFTGDPTLTSVLDPCITGSSQPAVADGFYVMLHPLAVGPHTIVFSGNSANVQTTVTYQITMADGD